MTLAFIVAYLYMCAYFCIFVCSYVMLHLVHVSLLQSWICDNKMALVFEKEMLCPFVLDFIWWYLLICIYIYWLCNTSRFRSTRYIWRCNIYCCARLRVRSRHTMGNYLKPRTEMRNYAEHVCSRWYMDGICSVWGSLNEIWDFLLDIHDSFIDF